MLKYTMKAIYSEQNYKYGTPHSRIEFLYDRAGYLPIIVIALLGMLFYLYIWGVIIKLTQILPKRQTSSNQRSELGSSTP